MTFRHFLGASALFVSVSAAITGCANKQRRPNGTAEEQPQQVERISQLAQTDPGQAPADEPKHTDLTVGSDKTEEILAQKTQSYAEEVERLLAARAAEKAAAVKQQQEQQTAPPTPVTPAAPTTKPAAAKSQVVFADPKQLPPAAATPTGAVAQAPAAQDKKDRTVIQLLDTAPATANQATHIPGPGEPAPAAAVTPVVDVKPFPTGARPQIPAQAGLTADALAHKLAERVKADPLDVGAHVDYQLHLMLNEQSVPELNSIAPLPQEEREVVSALMDGLSNFRNGIRNGGNTTLPNKLGPLIEMVDRIRTQSTLSIPSVVLCREVTQFGVYQPFENHRFLFGEKHPVVVYCEVANFVSQLNSRSFWETKLKYEVLLYTDSEKALEVWQQKSTPVVDQSHSRRRDFFIAKLLELPQDLPIGGYLMKVSIIDDTANRIAEATVPLQIVAK